MKLEVDPGLDSTLDALGRPTLELLRAARDRVAFQRDLQRQRSRVWRSGGDDSSGILVQTIDGLCDVGRGQEDDPATHSVRSLLATSLNGRHSVYVAIDCLTDHSHEPEERTEGSRERPSVDELAADDLNPLIERSPVLEGRSLLDLSIQVPEDDAARAELLLRAAQLVRRFEYPISHLHLPSNHLEGDRFRLGVGTDPLQVQRQLDFLAFACALAEDLGCGLEANGSLLRGWRRFAPDRAGSAVRRQIPVGWQAQLVAQAHVGLIAGLAEQLHAAGLPVDHAAMTIIEGCTVITLGGLDDIDEASLLRCFDALVGLERIISCTVLPARDPTSAVGPPAADPPVEPLWVGWWCDNQPGGLVDLLRSLSEPLGDGYNITYVASRMIRGGRLNAGKLRAIPSGPALTLKEREAILESVNGARLPSGLRISMSREESGLTHKSNPLRLR